MKVYSVFILFHYQFVLVSVSTFPCRILIFTPLQLSSHAFIILAYIGYLVQGVGFTRVFLIPNYLTHFDASIESHVRGYCAFFKL
jgi:hypothetical protein